jgi:hypothetical protein
LQYFEYSTRELSNYLGLGEVEGLLMVWCLDTVARQPLGG